MSSFNWGDLQQAAEDAGFSNVPAGTYDAEVVKAEAKKTGTGKDKIATQFKIMGGPNDGRRVFSDFVISPENATALGFFFRHMKAMGLGREYFATNPQLITVAAALVGKTCQVVVGIREWNGEERNEVTSIKPPQAGAAASVSMAKGPQPSPMAQPTPMAQPVPQPAAAVTPAPAPAQAPAPVPVAQVTQAPVQVVKDTTIEPDQVNEGADEPQADEGGLPDAPNLPF